jgi:hypothetical protein
MGQETSLDGASVGADYAEWLRVGTHIIPVATLSAEIAALGWHSDPEGLLLATKNADERAARTMKEAIDHLAASPLVAENRRLSDEKKALAEAISEALDAGNDGDWQSARKALARALSSTKEQT